jgi:hypothetical protein
MGVVCGTHGGEEKYMKNCGCGNLKEKDYLEVLEVNERIIPKIF